jgi:hypothetical protein
LAATDAAGGFATTTVVFSGRDAIAGGAAGAATTALEGWRGCGITVFFAGAAGSGVFSAAAGLAAAFAAGATTAFAAALGATAPLSAALRARMAFSASPGLETPERSNFGSAFAALAAAGRPLVR